MCNVKNIVLKEMYKLPNFFIQCKSFLIHVVNFRITTVICYSNSSIPCNKLLNEIILKDDKYIQISNILYTNSSLNREEIHAKLLTKSF